LDQDDSEEGYENFFCSEFITGALIAGRVIDSINPAQVTPIELCRFHLYEDDYTQFKGEAARIHGWSFKVGGMNTALQKTLERSRGLQMCKFEKVQVCTLARLHRVTWQV